VIVVPLKDRPSFKADHDHDLIDATRELRELREQHGLTGVVVISFYGDRVGVNSSGSNPVFGEAMHDLADRVLIAIDDGYFDPEKPKAN
jgi:hypothetical protein